MNLSAERCTGLLKQSKASAVTEMMPKTAPTASAAGQKLGLSSLLHFSAARGPLA